MSEREAIEVQTTHQVVEGFICNGFSKDVALLRAAEVMNKSHDKIKEEYYGKIN
ncbi:MAG: hypothetical protein KBB83_06720 [Alphaproteobacteria bacterium]|jgi:hypothetical protein|nr:hypothetical protein [Alphaproteobacteria bacterium]